MSTTDRAAQIRAELKRRGITSRQVSVRADYFSGGSAIDCRVKDPDVSLRDVRKVAEEHESIRRCEYSGEILSGSNRYISVEYTEEAKDALAAQYLPAIETAMQEASAGKPEYLVSIAGTEYSVQRPDPWRWHLWGKGSMAVGHCHDAKSLAYGIVWHLSK